MRVIKATLVGGIFFLVPIVLVVVILSKVFHFMKELIAPILKDFPGTILHHEAMRELIAVIILLVICFFIGLFARTAFAKKFIQKIENGVLGAVPGYNFMKSMGESVMGVQTKKDLPVVLIRIGDGWLMAFQIEQINENIYTVFLPDAPSPWTGSILYIEKDNIMPLSITQKQAFDIIKQLGSGSRSFLQNIAFNNN